MTEQPEAALLATPVAYIRAAHGDPGQFLPREPGESVPSWGARAALVALDRAGYAIVAKQAETREVPDEQAK